jgi:hypothetical protein
MNKITQIKNFIATNNPTRKEIVKFIIVNINGKSEEHYDYSNHRGHYSTNFGTWKRYGYVVTDSKHRYSLTALGKKSNSFYAMPTKMKDDLEQRRLSFLDVRYSELKIENYELRKELYGIKTKLRNSLTILMEEL